MDELVEYYRRRAAEYESIYLRDDPDERAELPRIAAAVREAAAGRRLLDAACGRGWWAREALSATRAVVGPGAARAVVGVDAAPEMLVGARARLGTAVALVRGDVHRLPFRAGAFEAAVAGFWLSHLPRAGVGLWLRELGRVLVTGAPVVLCDNVLRPEVGGELLRAEPAGDTWRRRTLEDGSVHQVRKNYFTAAELEALLEPLGEEVSVDFGRAYWIARYRSRHQP